MASAGDGFVFSSFTSSVVTTLQGTKIAEYDSGNNTYYDCLYCYVSSPAWWAEIDIKKNWGSYGREAVFYANYWNGSSWVQAYRWSHSWSWTDSGTRAYWFAHNMDGITFSSDETDSVPSAILWELVFSMPELYLKKFFIWTGGLGFMGETKYNDYYKGKYLYSAGNLGGASYWYTGGLNKQDRNGALTKFSQSANTGTQITAANADKLVGYKYC